TGLAALARAVVAARRVRVAARLSLALAGSVLVAVCLTGAAGAAAAQPWLTPAQAVVVALAALGPTVVLRPGPGSALPPGGTLPAGRAFDSWWVLWVLGWGAGSGLAALVAGAAAVLAGAPAAAVAGPVVAGALATAAATGTRRVSAGRGDGSPVADWSVPVVTGAVAVLLAVAAGPVWDGGGLDLLLAPAVVAGAVAGGLAVAAATVAARVRPQA
ncbi:MAG: hypothetical protein ACFCVG_05390, partial [Kineosporiaceae bacterium]